MDKDTKKLHTGEVFFLRHALEQIDFWEKELQARLQAVLQDHGLEPDEATIDVGRGVIVLKPQEKAEE